MAYRLSTGHTHRTWKDLAKLVLLYRSPVIYYRSYEHGVWLVEFAPLSDPALITQAVAAVIGVREYPGVELSQAVFEYLSSRHILLVFDNCEHLITDIARFVDNLFRKCPRLTILTTSREGLGILGEAIWTVPPLSLPIQKPWTDSSQCPGNS